MAGSVAGISGKKSASTHLSGRSLTKAQVTFNAQMQFSAVRIFGDFIADSPGITELEARLRWTEINKRNVALIIDEVLGAPGHIILGLKRLGSVLEAIMGVLDREQSGRENLERAGFQDCKYWHCRDVLPKIFLELVEERGLLTPDPGLSECRCNPDLILETARRYLDPRRLVIVSAGTTGANT